MVAKDIAEYRDTARFLLAPTDNVLELGCHEGMTLTVIDRYVTAGNVVGVDTNPTCEESDPAR